MGGGLEILFRIQIIFGMIKLLESTKRKINIPKIIKLLEAVFVDRIRVNFLAEFGTLIWQRFGLFKQTWIIHSLSSLGMTAKTEAVKSVPVRDSVRIHK